MSQNVRTSEKSELTPKQQELIGLLLSGVNITAAAGQLKVNEKTLRRWLKEEHVEKAYQAAKDDLFQQVLVSLQKQSAGTLRRHILADCEPTPGSQLRAIALVFEQVTVLGKLAEMEEKMDRLEELIRQSTMEGNGRR